jgi:hypothetical protein
VISLPRNSSKTLKKESNHTSTCGNGLMWYKQNQLYVLKGKLKDVLLKECHDGPLVGHGGAKLTITFFKKTYYWPNLKDDAKDYMKICLICQ